MTDAAPDLDAAFASSALPPRRAQSSASVEKHQFGSAAPQLSGELGALGILHERFARSLRRAFLPLLRYQPTIKLRGIENRAYDDYVGGLRSHLVCFNIVRVEPLRGTILISVEPNLVSALVDGFFGGKGQSKPRTSGDFTPTEERVVQRLIESLCAGLSRAWEEVGALKFSFVGTESNPALAVFLEQDDAVLVAPLEITLGEGTAQLDILYPVNLLKPLLPALRSKIQADRIEGSSDWREKLKRAVMEIPISVRAVLAEPKAPMGALMDLRGGDEIAIQSSDKIRLLAAGLPFALGQLGEQGGMAAVQLERLLPPADIERGAP